MNRFRRKAQSLIGLVETNRVCSYQFHDRKSFGRVKSKKRHFYRSTRVRGPRCERRITRSLRSRACGELRGPKCERWARRSLRSLAPSELRGRAEPPNRLHTPYTQNSRNFLSPAKFQNRLQRLFMNRSRPSAHRRIGLVELNKVRSHHFRDRKSPEREKSKKRYNIGYYVIFAKFF